MARVRALLLASVVISCIGAFAQQYKVLYSFGSVRGDGQYPVDDLVRDKAGNLYGLTYQGGTGGGTIFQLSPGQDGSWTETILYEFCDGSPCSQGSLAEGLSIDSHGNLFGTTQYGGQSPSCPYDAGCGVVFELSPPVQLGGTWDYSVIYSFCMIFANGACQDGMNPGASPTIDAAGTIYGTTFYGGASANPQGVAFELSLGSGGWTEQVLYNFCSLQFCEDGVGGSFLTLNSSGSLYGSSDTGGSPTSFGGGVLYELSPGAEGWSESVLQIFPPPKQGNNLIGTVATDAIGDL